MVFKKPVIATLVGGNSELVVNNITGFLVEPNNAGELINKIEYLVKEPEIRIKMGGLGKKKILQDFTTEKMLESYIWQYKNINKGE